MAVFDPFRNRNWSRRRQGFGTAITLSIEDQAIRAMSQPIQGRCAQHFVGGECIAPLAKVQIAGQQGGGPLIAFGDQVMERLILGGDGAA